MNKKTKQDKLNDRTPMDAAMRYLGYSARTIREMERHLDDNQFGEVEIYDTVERLKELKLLDDNAYCESFIESRLRTKPVSRLHLIQQLKEHEADENAISDAISIVTEEVERDCARAVAEKFYRQFSELDEPERRHRVQARLSARGFGYDTVRLVTESLGEDTE